MEIDILLKNTSRSLYLSVQALPKRIQPAFGVAYLLCRYADTIADTELLPSQRRYYWVDRFAQIVQQQNPAEEKQLMSEISGKSENSYEEALIKNLPPCLNAFNQLEDLYKPFILDVVQSVCEGMKIDLSYFSNIPSDTPKAFATDADLAHYCRLMGGKPGRFWSQLIYHTVSIPLEEEKFYELGEQVGDSLQIVNILRDLPKDLQLGRCYFPQTDLDTAHLTTAQLTNPACSTRFEPIKQKWIQWGKKKLSEGKTYYSLLPKTQMRIRASVAWPMLWTADTFFKLSQETDLLNPKKRVKIPRSTIYRTMFATPTILLSNSLFNRWLDKKLRKLP
ncbi:MAG: squalene/phytoene synthase family protein [Elusimicrobiaceae bacterium]|nr:squalene/phytoene synthase family protein [Elusimicrobiaceae bacterium]